MLELEETIKIVDSMVIHHSYDGKSRLPKQYCERWGKKKSSESG